MSENETTELRKWCFDMALRCRQEDMDIVEDIIYRASEIEEYVTNGKNARREFHCCVDTALAEVAHASIPSVSEPKKEKVLEVVRKWLKEYHAL